MGDMDTPYALAGIVLAALLVIHLAKRIASPIRTTVFLESGKVVRINLRRVSASRTSIAWTAGSLTGEHLHLGAIENIQAIKMVNRLKNF